MEYDFDRIIDRRGSQCEKWDGLAERFGDLGPDPLALWVADMDFAAPPAVLAALARRLDHGVFGYAHPGPRFLEAARSFMARRHGWNIKTDWLRYTPGVVAGLAFCVQALTEPGQGVLYQSPVYPPIFGCVTANCRVPVNSPLVRRDGRYCMDFEDIERKLDQNVGLAILCSPHNPVGRVWNREELIRFATLCHKRGVPVVSDEIHHDLVLPPHRHLVLASLPEAADNCLTLFAPSKTFNIAGLQTSLCAVKNPKLRARLDRVLRANAAFGPSAFGLEALIAACERCDPWLEALLTYLTANRDLLAAYLAQRLPGIGLSPVEATHLAWLDLSGLGLSDEAVAAGLSRVGLALNAGPSFGPGGQGFVRLNFACPGSVLEKGLERLAAAFGPADAGT